ncbi:sugar transferase [Psychroflexus sp. ALD_RP9]|uniref:sugar transferase n=1 Tax=Psychroflexus sp. ALD_RP9 TaxID=2777186 RepID=UPI001A903334|nr:sugar transferase [Psychroflexus sp. ALD_RP9]QSS96241.1 sugar transferase [Psychroflexus sp. ALD_RP9]
MYIKFGKVLFDTLLATILFLALLPILLLISIILLFLHKDSPFFTQIRIGQYTKEFKIYKFKTITSTGEKSSFMKFLRKTKLDETLQLLNIIKQEMSFVGPRPDIPGYYDQLSPKYSAISSLKPGLTGYASLKFSNEESLLSKHKNPLKYNDEVIFPEKLRLNLKYQKEISFKTDLKLLFITFLVVLNLTNYDTKI